MKFYKFLLSLSLLFVGTLAFGATFSKVEKKDVKHDLHIVLMENSSSIVVYVDGDDGPILRFSDCLYSYLYLYFNVKDKPYVFLKETTHYGGRSLSSINILLCHQKKC